MDVHQDFPQIVQDLACFLNEGPGESHHLNGISAQPGKLKETSPAIWLLGSSDYSARIAAEMGLPFSFADFFGNTSEYGPQITDLYRKLFEPSKFLTAPKVNVSVQVTCAPTEEEARFVGSSRNLNKIISRLGFSTQGLIPPEEAVDWPLDSYAREYMEQSSQSNIEGEPDQVKERILMVAERYQTGDIGVVTNCYDFEHRKRSYSLVAESFRSQGIGDPAPIGDNAGTNI